MNLLNGRSYYNYLLGRSRVGWLYRNAYLYPCLARYLHGNVVDIGCGIGDFLSYRHNTVGLDINPCTVEHCRSLGHEVQLINGDIYPFGNNFFDGGIMDNVLEHIVNPTRVLAEIYRILKPGATLIVGVPGIKGYAMDQDHKVFYDENTLNATLSSAGFSLRTILFMPLGVRYLERYLSQYCLYGVFDRS